MLVDEVIVERSQNLTVKDLRGMKGGILGKGNKVKGRKALGCLGKRKGEGYSGKVGYRWRTRGR